MHLFVLSYAQVYAVDLLGFGESDKPGQQYTIETWGRLVADFVSEFMDGQAPVLVGNSIGSLVCLTVSWVVSRVCFLLQQEEKPK
jgi:pimeloyl-ACP methyl ester carboxylesterase